MTPPHPTWVTPSTVDLWGPPVTQPAPPPPPRERTGRPWGLGDVWLTLFMLVGTQLVLTAALLAGHIRSTQRLDQITAESLDAAFQALPTLVASPDFLVVAMLTQWAVFVAVPWWASFRKGLRSLATDFGLRFTVRDIPAGVGVAVAAQVGLYGLNTALGWAGVDLSSATNTGIVTDQSGAMLAFMLAGAAVVAPVTEEILFRGLTLRAMLRSFAGVDAAGDPYFAGRWRRVKTDTPSRARQRAGVVAAVVASSALFGILHMPDAAGIGQVILPVETGLLGALLAVVSLKTGRIGAAVIAHVVFNSASLALTML